MALDEAAVAQACASIIAANPAGAPVMMQFVRDIFQAIKDNAEVDPTLAGTPMTVTVGAPGVTPVNGTGKIT